MTRTLLTGLLVFASLFSSLRAQTPGTDFLAEYKSLSDAYRKASSEFAREIRKAKPEDMAALYDDRAKNPVYAYIPQMAALADRAKGTEVEFRCWQFVFNNRMRFKDAELAEWQTKSLAALKTHIDRDYFSEFVARMGGSGLPAEEADAIRARCEASTNVNVKTAALFAKGALLFGAENDAAKSADGRAILKSIMDDPAMAAVKVSDTTYGKRIEGMFFSRDFLSIGKVAPDFDAVDQDGKAWKLSDYRGQVVVVDFWGFW